MHTIETTQCSALHALDWLHAMGSDECIGNAPASWFDIKDEVFVAAPKITRPVIDIRQEIVVPVLPMSQLSVKAAEIAKNCENLPQLYEAIVQFEGFSRFQKIENTPIWQGSLAAKLMIIAETPMCNLVGDASNLFVKICKSAGFNLENDCYSTTILPFICASTRGFTPQDYALGVPFLKRHIELQNPEHILFLGNSALHVLPNASAGLLKLRGNWHDLAINGTNFKSFVTFHPSFLFKQPAQKKLVWHDMRVLRKKCNIPNVYQTLAGALANREA